MEVFPQLSFPPCLFLPFCAALFAVLFLKKGNIYRKFIFYQKYSALLYSGKTSPFFSYVSVLSIPAGSWSIGYFRLPVKHTLQQIFMQSGSFLHKRHQWLNPNCPPAWVCIASAQHHLHPSCTAQDKDCTEGLDLLCRWSLMRWWPHKWEGEPTSWFERVLVGKNPIVVSSTKMINRIK